MKIRYILFLLLIFLANNALFSQSETYSDWMNKTAQFIEKNQLDSAVVTLKKALASDPENENNALILLNLGVLQRQLNLFDDAYFSLTASANASNNAPLVLHNRASLLVEMERYDEAMEDYNLLIQQDAEDVEAYYRRGLLFLEKGDREKAEADFVAAEQANPKHLFTKLSKALLHKLDGDWSTAEKIYSDIIASEAEKNSVYYLNRAECYLNMGQASRAAADIHTIEREQRNNPYFYILRGRLRLEQFDKFAAKADFEKAKSMGYDAEIADEWLKKTK